MNQYTGSNFDDFLAEEGVLDEVTARAYKRLWDLQVQDAMAEAHLSKTELAGRLQTSRSQLDRLLDPENTSVTLDSLERLAAPSASNWSSGWPSSHLKANCTTRDRDRRFKLTAPRQPGMEGVRTFARSNVSIAKHPCGMCQRSNVPTCQRAWPAPSAACWPSCRGCRTSQHWNVDTF